MTITLYSDLHLEFAPWEPPALDAEVVILAGDIAVGTAGIAWAAETFRRRSPTPEILYIPGNHEYYGGDIEIIRREMRAAARKEGIHLLDNDTFTSGNVRFLGTTLWSDFSFYESEEWTKRSIATAATSLNDYTAIRKGARSLTPADTITLHRDARAWLNEELRKPFNGKTVVITHFAPHRGCVAARYDGDILTPYFVVNLAQIMRAHRPDLWMFGHTHHNVDIVDESGCRVVCNQRGYMKEAHAIGFRPDFVLSL
jgi:Icc-related predicted phosphoesterase